MLARNIRVEEDLVDQLFNSTEKLLACSRVMARKAIRKACFPKYRKRRSRR